MPKSQGRRISRQGLWRCRTVLALALLGHFGPGGTAAQTPGASSPKTGTIRGTLSTVQDNAPAALAGITLKLLSDPPKGEGWTADSGDAGAFEFVNLPPGKYILAVELPAFKAFRKAVTLEPGGTLAVDVRLEIETVAEQVEVKEQTQAIAADAAATPAEVVTDRVLLSLPTPQQKVREALPVTPGVVKTQDGKLNFKGADEGQSTMLVNSARTADPVSGSFSIPVPTDAVESFSVYKAPYNADVGSFSGGLTTVDTKPPEDQWNYKFRNVVPSVLAKNGSITGIAEALPGVAFGGPLFDHRVFFSEVFQYEMKKKTVRGLPWPEDISKKQGFNSFGTLEALLSDKHILLATVNAFPLRTRYADSNALVPQPASNDLDQSGLATAVSDKYQTDSGAIYSVIAQYTRFDSNAHGQGISGMLITPEGLGGNFFNRWSRRGKELQFLPSYQTARKHWLGHHEIHVGLDIDHRSYFGSNVSHPIQLLREDGTLAETIGFEPGPLEEASDSTVAEFVQDHWVMDPHWALDWGARLSSETEGWGAALAPRLGVAFSPWSEGKTVIRSGVGLFYGVLPLLAADFSQNPTRVVSEFDAAGQPLGPAVTYTNAYVGRSNPLSGAPLPFEPGTTPRNLTWSLSVDHQLKKNILLRAGYVDSHTTYLFVAQPFTQVTAAQSYLGLSNTGSSHYRELEGTVRFTIRDQNQVSASYIRSRTRGDLNNLSDVFVPFAQPVIRPNVYGILPYDVPNRLVTWATLGLPRGFKFSPLADLHSGYPYSNVDPLQNYVGVPNGQRFATFFSLDIKVYKEFRMPLLGSKGKVHHLRLGFYSLNVTNHGNFNAVYNNVSSPLFGQFVGFLDRRDGAVIDFVD